MSAERNASLDFAAAGSFTIALAHVVAIVVGGPAYRYMGAEPLGALAESGSWVPAIVTTLVTMVFVVFGLYALAGAGRMPPLPWTRATLFIIGAVYALRGLVVIGDVVGSLRVPGYPARRAVFSAISLAIGLLYVFGAARMPRRES